MNKIKRKEKVNGKKKECFSKDTETSLVLLSDADFEIVFELLENAKVEVFHYGKDVTGKVKIHLKGENAHLIYHYNTVNQKENKVEVSLFHEYPKTESHLYFHGYNQENHALSFNINVAISKGSSGSVATQENRIFNAKEGRAFINPNLYVDEYDVEATHSSFTGPFDQNIQFYIETRGLSKEKAEQLLLEGLLVQEGLTKEEKVSFFQTRKEG